jgi:protein ImuB
MSRFAAVVLPCVHLELARARLVIEGAANDPLAIVVARNGGTVQRETDLLGNTRIDEVSREARALGVRRGQTIAAARAKTADLRVRVVHDDEVRVAIERVAEVALAFGTTTATRVADSAPTPAVGDAAVWIDVTGCDHLFGGEALLAKKIGEHVRAMGHACRVAIADGPRVAAAVAGHAPYERTGPFVVPRGKNAAAIRALSLAALPLDDEARTWLSRVGMRTAGDLQKLPARGLGTRLGAASHDVMALLRGEDATPLDPYRPPATLEERIDLDYGVESTEAIFFVTKTLCDRIAVRLLGRAMAASRVEIVMTLDRAMIRDEDAGDAKVVLSLSLPMPMARAQDLFGVLRARVDAYATLHNDRFRAPVLAVTLRVPELSRAEGRALALFDAEPRADVALPRLVAELSAEIGEANIGVIELVDTWVPEARARLVPYANAKPCEPLVTTSPEPSRFLGAGVAPPSKPLARPKLLARLEAIEWWRRDVVVRDLVSAEIDQPSSKARAVAWIEIERDAVDGSRATAKLRGWMD